MPTWIRLRQAPCHSYISPRENKLRSAYPYTRLDPSGRLTSTHFWDCVSRKWDERVSVGIRLQPADSERTRGSAFQPSEQFIKDDVTRQLVTSAAKLSAHVIFSPTDQMCVRQVVRSYSFSSTWLLHRSFRMSYLREVYAFKSKRSSGTLEEGTNAHLDCDQC